MTSNPVLAHPPKAQLTVRVGVTGHRPNRLAHGDETLLRARIRAVLSAVVAETNAVHAAAKTAYDPASPLLRVNSSLAEGADRLVAEEALTLNYQLQCPLPFARDEYARDFASDVARGAYHALLSRATAVLELVNSRDAPDQENEAYEAAGRVMLRQSDALIVIWDGEPPTGQGGTGQIVKEALHQHIPCVWIHADAPHPLGVLDASDITDAGAATAEARLSLTIDSSLALFIDHLRQLLQPPPPPKVAKPKLGWNTISHRLLFPETDPRQDYFAEQQPKSVLGGIWAKLFRNMFTGSWRIPSPRFPDIIRNTTEEWRNIRTAAPDFPVEVADQVEQRFCHHYAWADKLGEYYVNLYRSSFVLNYLLSAGAVLLALLSFASSGMMHTVTEYSADSYRASRAFDYFVAGEMILVLTIVFNIVLGRRYRWHERWIDYRFLAEQFRQMRFLALLGHNPLGFQLLAHHAYDDPGNSWMSWHSRAVIRAAGLVTARIDAAYLKAYCCLLTCRDSENPDLSPGEIQGQINYHQENAKQLYGIVHRLHWLGFILFLLTLAVCVDHLVFHFIPTSISMVLAGATPALGAALIGILSQGEFERLVKRSKAMHHTLERLLKSIHQESVTPTFNVLGRKADEAADIMMTEVLDWRIVFLEKPLALPS